MPFCEERSPGGNCQLLRGDQQPSFGCRLRLMKLMLIANEHPNLIINSSVMRERSALLICCSVGEAKKIRREAEFERRTVAGYVLNVLSRALKLEERLFAQLSGGFQRLNRVLARTQIRPPGKRTAILIRCSVAEADQVRLAAKRRDMTISGFVLHCLKRNWDVNRGKPTPPHNSGWIDVEKAKESAKQAAFEFIVAELELGTTFALIVKTKAAASNEVALRNFKHARTAHDSVKHFLRRMALDPEAVDHISIKLERLHSLLTEFRRQHPEFQQL